MAFALGIWKRPSRPRGAAVREKIFRPRRQRACWTGQHQARPHGRRRGHQPAAVPSRPATCTVQEVQPFERPDPSGMVSCNNRQILTYHLMYQGPLFQQLKRRHTLLQYIAWPSFHRRPRRMSVPVARTDTTTSSPHTSSSRSTFTSLATSLHG